jgi:putative sterol carrier protein
MLGTAIADDVSPALSLLAEIAGAGAGYYGLVIRTQLLAARYLSRYATEALQQRYLSPLLAGRRVASLAIGEDGSAPAEAAIPDGDSPMLVSGLLSMAAGAAECDMVLLAVDNGSGLSLAVVDVDSDGIQLLQGTHPKHWPSFEIKLERVALSGDHILGRPGNGSEHLRSELPVALLTSAATIVSIAGHAWQSLLPQNRRLGSDLTAAQKALFKAASRHKNDRSFLKTSYRAERLARRLITRVIAERLRHAEPSTLIHTATGFLGLPEQTFYLEPNDLAGSAEGRASSGDPDSTTEQPIPSTVSDLISSLPSRFRSERAADWTATFHFKLKGDPHPHWTVSLSDGRCQVREGFHGVPSCIVRMKAETYIGIESGSVNPQAAFMTGRVKVSDLAQMMRYIKSFRPANQAGQKP